AEAEPAGQPAVGSPGALGVPAHGENADLVEDAEPVEDAELIEDEEFIDGADLIEDAEPADDLDAELLLVGKDEESAPGREPGRVEQAGQANRAAADAAAAVPRRK